MSTRKPTNNELKTAINNLIYELNVMHKGIMKIDGVLSSYIDFMGNKDKWLEYVNKKVSKDEENLNDTRSKESGDSSRGNGDAKTNKSTTKKSNKKTKK